MIHKSVYWILDEISKSLESYESIPLLFLFQMCYFSLSHGHFHLFLSCSFLHKTLFKILFKYWVHLQRLCLHSVRNGLLGTRLLFANKRMTLCLCTWMSERELGGRVRAQADLDSQFTIVVQNSENTSNCPGWSQSMSTLVIYYYIFPACMRPVDDRRLKIGQMLLYLFIWF